MSGLIFIRYCIVAALFFSALTIANVEPVDTGAEGRGDTASVLINRKGLKHVIQYMLSTPDIFSGYKTDNRLLGPDQRKAVIRSWAQFSDYVVALESISDDNAAFYVRRGDEYYAGLYLHMLSFYTAYHFAMAYIGIVEMNPDLSTLLNEEDESLGIGKNSYLRFKIHYLNPHIASRFAALEVLRKVASRQASPHVQSAIDEDARHIWTYSRGKGIKLTTENAVDVLKQLGFKTWFPLQKNIASGMGHIRVLRHGKALITEDQVQSMKETLEPGDILLEHREWYMTNVGIPGYWPHAALYVGTPQQRKKMLHPHVAVQQWVRGLGVSSGDFETLLAQKYPQAYRNSLAHTDGREVRVIEAIASGVVFTSLEQSAYADSIAAVRPRLSHLDKAKAIYRAFTFAGKPYDYNFDFLTDAELVCSELIYKAYQPEGEKKGVKFPLTSIAGRKIMPANDIAKMYTDEFGSDQQQLDLIFFLDGDEGAGMARRASAQAFNNSWKRPKWHIITQRNVSDNLAP